MRTINKIFIVVIALSLNISIAQITFEKTYGGVSREWGNSVSQTSDGGYIIAGNTRSLMETKYGWVKSRLLAVSSTSFSFHLK